MASSASASIPASGSPARYLRHVAKNISRTSSREGLNTGLGAELAEVADHAFGAAGLSRDADVASVQDQPMVRVLQELRRRELQQLLLDRLDVPARREAGAVRDAEDVR